MLALPRKVWIAVVLAVAVPLLISERGGGWTRKHTSSSTFRFDSIPDLRGKTAIVTGANSGIGFVTARCMPWLAPDPHPPIILDPPTDVYVSGHPCQSPPTNHQGARQEGRSSHRDCTL